MAGRLDGKIAVIVGAGASGPSTTATTSNGRAATLVFAREGARVFAIDVDAASLQQTHDAVVKEGGTITSAVADIRDFAAVQRVIAQCVSAYGTIDVLHNNVGIGIAGGAVSTTDEVWERVLDTNLVGVRNTCRAVLPIMEKAGRGSIVNVSTSLAHRSLRNVRHFAYPVSKAGVEALTRMIAVEYGSKGIRANNLIVGSIDTPVSRAAYEERRKIPSMAEEAERHWRVRGSFPPLGRPGTPWEVAQAALFLASDESSYITGTGILVDGGVSVLQQT